jgi:YVTN family beta-propeller protein
MEKQSNLTIKAYLRSAFYFLLFAGCAIPFALADSCSSGTQEDLERTNARLTQSSRMPQMMPPSTRAASGWLAHRRIGLGSFHATAAGATPTAPAPAVVAYVPNSGSNNVSMIDTATNAVVATVTVGNGPNGAAMKPI